jgi:bacteriocin-like protein
MTNEGKQAQREKKPEERPATPLVQIELTEEDLKQVVGGSDPVTNNDDKIRR